MRTREVSPHYRVCGNLRIYFYDYHHIYLIEHLNKFKITPLYKKVGIVRNWRLMWNSLHKKTPMDMTTALKIATSAGFMVVGARGLPDLSAAQEMPLAGEGESC